MPFSWVFQLVLMNPGVRAPFPCPSRPCPSPPPPLRARTLDPGSLPSPCTSSGAPPETGLWNLRDCPSCRSLLCSAPETLSGLWILDSHLFLFFNGGFIIGNDYVRMYVTLVDLSWVVGRGRECSGRFVVGRGRECSDGCGLHSIEVFADYRVALHSG